MTSKAVGAGPRACPLKQTPARAGPTGRLRTEDAGTINFADCRAPDSARNDETRF